MWINTARTEEIRQHLEAEFNKNLAVEQRFPSHPIDGIQLRAYRTNGSNERVVFGSNYLELHSAVQTEL